MFYTIINSQPEQFQPNPAEEHAGSGELRRYWTFEEENEDEDEDEDEKENKGKVPVALVLPDNKSWYFSPLGF